MRVEPVTLIAPVVFTSFSDTAPPVTVKVVSLVVPPMASDTVTAPPCASSVSVCAPFTVEEKVIEPSVVSSSLSLSTVTAPVRVTGSLKVMAPSAVETFAPSVVVPAESNLSEALPPMLRASVTEMEAAEIELPAPPLPVGPVVAVPRTMVPEVVSRPSSALLSMPLLPIVSAAVACEGAMWMSPAPALMLAALPDVVEMAKSAPISVMLPPFDVMVTLSPIVSFPVPSLSVPDCGESASKMKLWAPFVPVMLALMMRWRPACSVSVLAELPLRSIGELTVMSCVACSVMSALMASNAEGLML